MTAITMPDTDLAVRDWLRSLTDVTALVQSSRIGLGTVSFTSDPQIVVTRVGGGDDGSEAPLDEALIQIDCWSGSTPSRTQAAAVKNAVRAAVKTLRHIDVGGVTLYGAQVISDVFLPDQSSDLPRYALTVQLTTASR